MKFDIIISNPPYQEETGAGTIVTGKKPIYQNFTLFSLSKSNRFICTIIPSRWTMNGTGMVQLYNQLECNRHHFRSIVDYMDWTIPVFNNSIQIAGGVMYFLIDKKYTGKCIYKNIEKTREESDVRELIFEPAFIRSNSLQGIIHKVQERKEATIQDKCRTNTFGLDSFERGTRDGNCLLLTSSGTCSILKSKIGSNIKLIDKYKLAISGTTPGGGAGNKDGTYKVLASLIPLEPNQVCTNTYITVGGYDTYDEVINLMEYLQTKFVRSLILATIASMHIIPHSFVYVPTQDFSVKWTDEQLYKKYELTEKEIEYIERTIKAW